MSLSMFLVLIIQNDRCDNVHQGVVGVIIKRSQFYVVHYTLLYI